MSNFFWQSFKLFILFGRNTAGCINSPYITYRRLAKTDSRIEQTAFILFFSFLYFLFASTIRVGLNNPFFLTLKFNLLVFGTLFGFVLMIFSILIFGRIFGGTGKLRNITLLWSYSLLPTLFWFFATSILYVILPPPRTFSVFGKIYSVVFVGFSMAVFFWKIILYYLTLRFGMRLDLLKIIGTSVVLFSIIIGYSLVMYRLGIFRVPFI